MKTIVVILSLALSALIWYSGQLKSTSDAALSQLADLRQSNSSVKEALKNAADSQIWNRQAVKDIFGSDLAIENKERRLKMAAIIHIYQMNGEYKRLGIESPYADSLLYDLRAEYQELQKAEGMLKEGEFLTLPSERMLVLPTGEEMEVKRIE